RPHPGAAGASLGAGRAGECGYGSGEGCRRRPRSVTCAEPTGARVRRSTGPKAAARRAGGLPPVKVPRRHMRVGAIDIGSTSIRLLVADVPAGAEPGELVTVARAGEACRL